MDSHYVAGGCDTAFSAESPCELKKHEHLRIACRNLTSSIVRNQRYRLRRARDFLENVFLVILCYDTGGYLAVHSDEGVDDPRVIHGSPPFDQNCERSII